MPDGDVIYGNLSPAYGRLYIELREGAFDTATTAAHFIEPTRHSLKRLGDEPIAFLVDVAEHCRSLSTGLMAVDTDWRGVQRVIEGLARTTDGTKRGLALAQDVATRHLHQMRDAGAERPTTTELVRAYIGRVLVAEFVERLPIHSHGDPQLFAERLAQARGFLDTTFDVWADNAVRSGTFANFRNPLLRDLAPVTADTDLLTLR